METWMMGLGVVCAAVFLVTSYLLWQAEAMLTGIVFCPAIGWKAMFTYGLILLVSDTKAGMRRMMLLWVRTAMGCCGLLLIALSALAPTDWLAALLISGSVLLLSHGAFLLWTWVPIWDDLRQ